MAPRVGVWDSGDCWDDPNLVWGPLPDPIERIMSQLTHAQKKSFAADIPGILRSNAAAFTGKDFNPETRATEIDGLNDVVGRVGGIRVQKEADFHGAVTDENVAIDAAYAKASAAIKGAEGVLDKSHPLIKKLTNMRDLMVNEAARAKHPAPPSTPA